MIKVSLWLTAALVAFSCTFSFAASPSTPSPANSSLTQKITLNIEGMVCKGCANNLAEQLRALPGVVSSTVSFADKQAVVEFNPEKIDSTTIVASIHSKTRLKAQLKA